MGVHFADTGYTLEYQIQPAQDFLLKAASSQSSLLSRRVLGRMPTDKTSQLLKFNRRGHLFLVTQCSFRAGNRASGPED